jgi:hypothetical protein
MKSLTELNFSKGLIMPPDWKRTTDPELVEFYKSRERQTYPSEYDAVAKGKFEGFVIIFVEKFSCVLK